MVNNKVLMVSCLSLAIISLFLFGFTYLKYERYNGELSSPINITEKCRYSELEDTVECLVRDVRSWFIYNMSTQKTALNDEDLKKQGGVCWHYARYYERQLSAMGFEAKTITIDANDIWTGHRFTIAWNYNHSTYCLIDQERYECFWIVPVTRSELDSLFSVNKTL